MGESRQSHYCANVISYTSGQPHYMHPSQGASNDVNYVNTYIKVVII